MDDGLLSGMRVLDFGQWRPAPYATQLLADLGAEVLKVEQPGGDPMRAFPEIFATVAGHKRSVVLDLKDPRDRARALELAAEADVVVEGWRPGVAARLGVGPEDVRGVNPSVVYCSLSGFGASGPLRDAPGHDVNYQARGGVARARRRRACPFTVAARPVRRPCRWSRGGVRDLPRRGSGGSEPVKATPSTSR